MRSGVHMMETQIVIGVPGLWKDRTELIQEVVNKSNYILAGNVMHHKEKEIGFEIDIYEQGIEYTNIIEGYPIIMKSFVEMD
ncbi:hypothetical protein CON66_29775 [Bacillus cereus]|uniref:Uncharacterized protein n=2 Tax=Bacillus cereus group TaxID=86661 RepID=A0A9X6QC15_BACTU|nr:hypothetical protein bthur0006_44680 [Bacillus thuringiensis serovar kurstaki str. T03a001]OTW52902.1 hypothetical protein BK701_24690 [Bacillus thuringiensis serovar amagiensis]OTY55135.1 hypothetical protein BK747_26375 [Bacillus thuringiensis serovar azorensis]OTY82040.1 hypothetical protein BK751_27515 [Bacillus thuringiensis serovar galleriae]OTY91044.1 hypothetical protein BK755_07015 [Bacillus thuringiensis serovar aizawai]OTZ44425.1 hypothetical protein BK760_06525 [Bacillus thuring